MVQTVNVLGEALKKSASVFPDIGMYLFPGTRLLECLIVTGKMWARRKIF